MTPGWHIVSTLTLCEIFKIRGVDQLLAFGFGAAIDIDHFYNPRLVLARVKAAAKFGKSKEMGEIQNQFVFFHSIITPILAVIFSLIFHSWIPLIFLAVHILIDAIPKGNGLRWLKPLYSFKKEYSFGLLPAYSKIDLVGGYFLCMLFLVYYFFLKPCLLMVP